MKINGIENKPWIIYCRVSTRDQEPGAQERALREYAERSKLEPFEVVNEVQSSRKTRPIKDKCMARLRSGDAAGLLIWRLSRWGRSLDELVLDLNFFRVKEVPFISLSDGIDLSTPGGRLQAHIIGAVAEYEREIIRENTLSGLDNARAQGKRLGRPPGKKDSSPRRKSGYIARWDRAKEKYRIIA